MTIDILEKLLKLAGASRWEIRETSFYAVEVLTEGLNIDKMDLLTEICEDQLFGSHFYIKSFPKPTIQPFINSTQPLPAGSNEIKWHAYHDFLKSSLVGLSGLTAWHVEELSEETKAEFFAAIEKLEAEGGTLKPVNCQHKSRHYVSFDGREEFDYCEKCEARL